jgi:hypothetical protein
MNATETTLGTASSRFIYILQSKTISKHVCLLIVMTIQYQSVSVIDEPVNQPHLLLLGQSGHPRHPHALAIISAERAGVYSSTL